MYFGDLFPILDTPKLGCISEVCSQFLTPLGGGLLWGLFLIIDTLGECVFWCVVPNSGNSVFCGFLLRESLVTCKGVLWPFLNMFYLFCPCNHVSVLLGYFISSFIYFF